MRRKALLQQVHANTDELRQRVATAVAATRARPNRSKLEQQISDSIESLIGVDLKKLKRITVRTAFLLSLVGAGMWRGNY